MYVLGLVAGSAAWELHVGIDPYNRFANAYNSFIERAGKGVVDLRALKRMRSAWRALEKSENWPEEKQACAASK